MAAVELARASEIDEGAMVAIGVEGRRILLAKVDGGIYAIDDLCTHEGAALHRGFLGGFDGDDPFCVTCPLHAARFDLRTGKVNPEDDWATDTRSYRVRVEGDTVLVDLEEDPARPRPRDIRGLAAR